MSDLLSLQMVAMRATRNLGFEQGVKSERERLAELIEAVELVRQASSDYDSTEGSGEIKYAEMMHEPIDLLIQALYEYEATND